MDAGKIAVSGLAVILMFNLVLWYMNERQIEPLPPISLLWSPTDFKQDFNATAIAEQYGAGLAPLASFYLANIVPTLQLMGRLLQFALLGLPALLIAIQCPTPIMIMLDIIYTVCWVITIAEIIRGLRFSQ